MQNTIMNLSKKLTICLFVVGLATTSFSCKDDDDKVDCNQIEDQLDDLAEDLYDAVTEEDCDEIEEVYDKAIALFKKGKTCDELEEIIEDSGADDIDEFIEMMEDERESTLDVVGC